jgi:hypothetical protein
VAALEGAADAAAAAAASSSSAALLRVHLLCGELRFSDMPLLLLLMQLLQLAPAMCACAGEHGQLAAFG